MDLTEGDTTNALKAEQDAWTQFRDKACQFYSDPVAFGREGQVLSFPNCVAETVAGRTEQLRAYLRKSIRKFRVSGIEIAICECHRR
jgi:uncharacterized protein YecT (DUF1311 family)